MLPAILPWLDRMERIMREFTIIATTAVGVRPATQRKVRQDDGSDAIEIVHCRSVQWRGLAEYVDPVTNIVSTRKSYPIHAGNARSVLPPDLAEYVEGRYPVEGPTTVKADPDKSAAVSAHLRSLKVLPVASSAEDALL